MKKMAIIFLLIALPSLAQNNKGKISLVYNEDKFDLPVTQIVVRKENSLMISARAERNDSLGQQMISLEFALVNMAKDAQLSSKDEIRLWIFNQEKKDPLGKRFTFNYGPKDVVVEMYLGNEKLNWSSPSFQFKFDNVEITHTNEGLKIKGSFSGKYNSTPQGTQLKTVAEIKEGKFEIIL